MHRIRVPFYAGGSALVARLRDAFRVDDIIEVAGLPWRVFCFRHPDHIKQVYTQPESAWNKPPGMLPRVRWIMGQGSFINGGGDDWKRRRKALQPMFTRVAAEQFLGVVSPAVEAMFERPPIDLGREMARLIVDIAFRALFAVELGDRLDPVVDDTLHLLGSFSDHTPLWLPFPKNFRYRRAARRIQAGMDSLPRGKGALAALAGWDDRDIRDEALSMFFGATIMRVPLIWSLYLLSKHPEFRGDSAERIFNEATRLYPPVWGYPRYCVEPMEIGGMSIPRHSVLFPIGYFAHRHPEFWIDAESFDPRRFSDGGRLHPFAHYPFGGGPRMCLGRHLAPLLCQKILAQVAPRATVRILDEPVPDFGFELAPRNTVGITWHFG